MMLTPDERIDIIAALREKADGDKIRAHEADMYALWAQTPEAREEQIGLAASYRESAERCAQLAEEMASEASCTDLECHGECRTPAHTDYPAA